MQWRIVAHGALSCTLSIKSKTSTIKFPAVTLWDRPARSFKGSVFDMMTSVIYTATETNILSTKPCQLFCLGSG